MSPCTHRYLDPEERNVVKLTEREGLVLRHLQNGSTNREIAKKLGISCDTVKCHIKNIFKKLKVNNRTQAAVKAVQIGLTIS